MSAKIKPSKKTFKYETVEEGLCEECGQVLPDPIYEDRGDGQKEEVTYCPCGAVYTN